MTDDKTDTRTWIASIALGALAGAGGVLLLGGLLVMLGR